MALTSNSYTGNGSTVLFSFTFPYLDTTDIKVSLNGVVTTAYTLANATTIQFNTAPANGVAIKIYRATNDSLAVATFYPGSAIRSVDLNNNFTQDLYVIQEANNASASAVTTAAGAVTTANTASTNASAAVSTANTASTNASAAVSTANTASTNASAAVTTANAASASAASATSTANTALSTANTASTNAASAVSVANTASTNASAAVTTANTASTNASAAVSTANTASTNASAAVSTANNALSVANTANTNSANAVTTSNTASATATSAAQDASNAIAAVSAASLYVIVAAVANIPTSPANNQGVQITNTTGLESFTPLSGKPVGFVGSSAVYARIRYSSSTSSWVWVDYAANDPENRYLPKTGGTLTGALTLSGAPSSSLQAATKAYVDAGDATLTTSVGTAQTTATSAQTTANTAVTNAAAAQTTANAALPKAGGTMTGAIVFDTTQTKASTTGYGITQLTDSVTSTSTTTAATPAAVKVANDAAAAAQSTANTAVTNAAAAQTTANTAVTNAATAQTTANNALPKAGGAMTGDLTLNAQSDLRFADADSSNWLAFQAPSTVSANVTWTLPATDASVSGYALKSDGSGQLSWGLAGGALGSGTNQIFYENDQTVTGTYSITAGKNAMTAGPVAINSGVTVTVPSGSSWTIV